MVRARILQHQAAPGMAAEGERTVAISSASSISSLFLRQRRKCYCHTTVLHLWTWLNTPTDGRNRRRSGQRAGSVHALAGYGTSVL